MNNKSFMDRAKKLLKEYGDAQSKRDRHPEKFERFWRDFSKKLSEFRKEHIRYLKEELSSSKKDHERNPQDKILSMRVEDLESELDYVRLSDLKDYVGHLELSYFEKKYVQPPKDIYKKGLDIKNELGSRKYPVELFFVASVNLLIIWMLSYYLILSPAQVDYVDDVTSHMEATFMSHLKSFVKSEPGFEGVDEAEIKRITDSGSYEDGVLERLESHIASVNMLYHKLVLEQDRIQNVLNSSEGDDSDLMLLEKLSLSNRRFTSSLSDYIKYNQMLSDSLKKLKEGNPNASNDVRVETSKNIADTYSHIIDLREHIKSEYNKRLKLEISGE